MRTAFRKSIAVLIGLLLMVAAAAGNDEAGAPMLLDFYSDWCGACRSMAPAVDALVQEGHVVRRINIDQEVGLARQYGVTSIPCFVVVQQGREIDRVTGIATTERLKLKMRAEGGGRKAEKVIAQKIPHPAWRYERAVGRRSCVVRVFCEDGASSRSIGSGALVRWNGRLVVLTARHVVQNAKRIVVELCTKKTHRARVVKVDAVWDCAVLELSGTPEGVEPAEIELGAAAVHQKGDRLESCGYGSDGRLACNSGRFLGYRRSTAAPQGPDDWLTMSGLARGGDSGGPIFNERGRLVGVLWGTDGKEVVGVQAGRIHRLLDAAAPKQAALPVEQKAIAARCPTPPKEPDSVASFPIPAAAEASTYGKPQPVLPWRDGAQKKDDAIEARIEALLELQERQSRAAASTAPAIAAAPSIHASEADKHHEKASPAVAAICMAAAVGLASAMYYLTAKEQ